MAGKKKEYWVTHKDDFWTVRRKGADEPVGRYLTKAQAVDAARWAASRDMPSLVVVQTRDELSRETWTPDGVDVAGKD